MSNTVNHQTSVFKQCEARLAQCTHCQTAAPGDLLEPGAFPLFQKEPSMPCRVLFVLEAPNRDDTFHSTKGYITMEMDTDPSGRFFRALYLNEARMNPEEMYVTNSVLCLPRRKGERHPVTSLMMKHCAENLRFMINTYQPSIVCPVGTAALRATKLIEDHGQTRLQDAVATPLPWFDRVLFPLYHTGMLARNGHSGRKADQQQNDWRELRRILDEVWP